MCVDVTDSAAVTEAVDSIVTAHGTPHAVVNNAGRGCFAAVETVAAEDVAALFNLNVGGVLNVVRAVLPSMRVAGRGHIVNIGSIVGTAPVPYMGIYAATKAAVHSLTDSLRTEVAPLGIQVSLLAPGRYDTGFSQRVTPTPAGFDPPYGDAALSWLEKWQTIDGREEPADVEEVAAATLATLQAPAATTILLGDDAVALEQRRRTASETAFLQFLANPGPST